MDVVDMMPGIALGAQCGLIAVGAGLLCRSIYYTWKKLGDHGDKYPWSVVYLSLLAGSAAGTTGMIWMNADKAPTDAPRPVDPPPPPPVEKPTTPHEPFQGPSSDDMIAIGMWGGVIIAILAVTVLLGWGAWKTRSALLEHKARRNALIARWTEISATISSVKLEYGKYLTDVKDQVFDRPLLNDYDEPLTRKFMIAWDTLRTYDFDTAPTDEAMMEKAALAAGEAERAWKKAASHAARIGLGELSSADAAKMRKASGLLEQALSPSIDVNLRNELLTKAQKFIDEVHRDGGQHLSIPAAIEQAAITAAGTGSGPKVITLPQLEGPSAATLIAGSAVAFATG